MDNVLRGWQGWSSPGGFLGSNELFKQPRPVRAPCPPSPLTSGSAAAGPGLGDRDTARQRVLGLGTLPGKDFKVGKEQIPLSSGRRRELMSPVARLSTGVGAGTCWGQAGMASAFPIDRSCEWGSPSLEKGPLKGLLLLT